MVVGLVCLTISARPGSAPAAPPNGQAEEAIREGRSSYNSGDYDAAIQSFKLAYATHADPEILYQLGKAYAMADWPVEALEAFERYLAAAHLSDERRREVTIAIAGQRRRVGSLVMQVTPEIATVQLDERLLVDAERSMPLPVRQGAHVISASADGYVTQTKVVQIRAGSPSVVHIGLSPSAPPTYDGLLLVRCRLPGVSVLVDGHAVATTPRSEPILVPEGEHHLSLRRAGSQSEEVTVHIARGKTAAHDCRLPIARPFVSSEQVLYEFEQRQRSRRTWAYGLGATGLAFASAAVVVGVWNHHRYGDWDRERQKLQQDYRASASTVEAAAALDSRREDVNHRLRSIHAVDIVTAILGVSGGMLLGSGALFILTAEQSPSRSDASVAWRSRPLGLGMNVAW